MRKSPVPTTASPAQPPRAEAGGPAEKAEELQRLRNENRRLAVSLGGFSAFIASKGLLEEAWHFVHHIHEQDDGEGDRAA